MKKLMLSLLVLGLLAVAPSVPSQDGAAAVAQANKVRFMMVDVAFDGRTFALNPVNPAATDLARGDTFVLNGKVYIGDAIPRGGTRDNPGPFTPDAPGSIATFICRGSSLYSGAEVAAGAAPYVATAQTFVFDNSNNRLFTEGLEGNISPIKRAVTGGLGEFSGAQGEVTMELLGFNTTGWENYRFTFRLDKK